MTEELTRPDQIAPLLADGRLGEAIAAATAMVKGAPNAAVNRILLAELLVLNGANERADNQLQLATDSAPAEALAISQMRWLLRAAEARRAWYEERGVPGFIGEPTQHQRDVMRLSLHVRDGESEETDKLRRELEDGFAIPRIAVDGGEAEPVRDVCDLSQHGFEALTLDGRYLWIAPEQVAEIGFEPARRPRDLIWRKADVNLRDGRDVVFYLVAQYFDPEGSDAQKLAKETAWIEDAGGIVRGRGQKILLVGEESRGFLDIEHIAVGA